MMLKLFLLCTFAVGALAQSLSISCPTAKNKPQTCPIALVPGPVPVASAQWKLITSPVVTLTFAATSPGKSLSAFNGTYLLVGINATPLTGEIAVVTIPAHSGNVRLTLSGAIGSSAAGHAVPVSPAVSVTVP